MVNDKFGLSDRADGNIRRKSSAESELILTGHFRLVCYGADGRLKWVDEGENLIVTTGRDWILTNDTAGGTLYLGLTDGTPTVVAGDTMASHAGWVEMAGYDEATRPLWGQGEPSAGVITNAAVATFTMDGTDTTVGGLFCTTDNVKDGTGGTLISAKALTGGDRTGILDNDVFEATYTITANST